MRKGYLQFFLLYLLCIIGTTRVFADVASYDTEAGTFTIDFYDADKLSSTTGTGITNNNYAKFVNVPDGINATDVVTGCSAYGTVAFNKAGGLTFGSSTSSSYGSHYVTFTIADEYKVNKVTVYAANYDSGVFFLNEKTFDSGTMAAKGTVLANVTNPLIWDNLGGETTLRFDQAGKADKSTGCKRNTIYKIVCEYSTGGGSTVTAPKFSPASDTEFYPTLDVTLSATEDIYYTTGTNYDDPNDVFVNGDEYSGAIHLDETTTIQAVALDDGGNFSGIATATYTKATPLSTMDAIFTASATAGNYYVTMTDWVVSGVSGNYAYITDGTKGFVAYKSGHGFEVGDKLNGTAKFALTRYNGAAEFTDLSSTTKGIEVTHDGVITPQVVSIADMGGENTGAVISLNNVKYNGTNLVDASNNTIKPYNTLFGSMAFTNGEKYNVTGVYIQYNAIKEIAPRTDEDIVLIPASKYAINITTPINGTVTTTPADEAAEDAAITIIATPSEGYKISTITVVDADDTPVSVTKKQFTMPGKAVTITVTFTEITPVAIVAYNAKDDKYWSMTNVIDNNKALALEISIKDEKACIPLDKLSAASWNITNYGTTDATIQDLTGKYLTKASGNTDIILGESECFWSYSNTNKSWYNGTRYVYESSTTTTNKYVFGTYVESNMNTGDDQHYSGYATEYQITPTYTRTGLTVGQLGSICLPYNATFEGAEVYSIAGKRMSGETPTSVVLEKVETIVAGKPYIINPTATTFTAWGTGAAAAAGSDKGLVGTFEDNTTVAQGNYILSGGKFCKVAVAGCYVDAYKAYLDMSAVSVYGGAAKEALEISVDDGEATGISHVGNVENAGNIYNLQGVRVNNSYKGIVISNGKKYLHK